MGEPKSDMGYVDGALFYLGEGYRGLVRIYRVFPTDGSPPFLYREYRLDGKNKMQTEMRAMKEIRAAVARHPRLNTFRIPEEVSLPGSPEWS